MKKHQKQPKQLNLFHMFCKSKDKDVKRTKEQASNAKYIKGQSLQQTKRSINNRQQKPAQDHQIIISSNTQYLSNISASSLSSPQPPSVNVSFYMNESSAEPNKEYIDTIHEQWQNNYDILEKNHSFIQWLFPNSFQSRFNPRSHPLTESEAIIFRSTAIIANRYVKSYEMMLGFYGMKLKNKRTGEITHCRRNNYRDRYHKTLLTSFHNHMRITRILASLVMVGFARYARELSRFLYSEIYDIQGDLKELKNFRIYQKEWAQFANIKDDQTTMSIYFEKIDKKK